MSSGQQESIDAICWGRRILSDNYRKGAIARSETGEVFSNIESESACSRLGHQAFRWAGGSHRYVVCGLDFSEGANRSAVLKVAQQLIASRLPGPSAIVMGHERLTINSEDISNRPELTSSKTTVTDFIVGKLAGSMVFLGGLRGIDELDSAKGRVWGILDQIESTIKRGEKIDRLHDQLEDLLEKDDAAAPSVVGWLEAAARLGLMVRYCVHLLRDVQSAEIQRYIIGLLRSPRSREEFLAGVIGVRRQKIDASFFDEVDSAIVKALDDYGSRPSVSESSLDETLLAELIDTAVVRLEDRAIPNIEPFYSRKWPLKIRLRALAGLQAIVTNHPSSPLVEAFIERAWKGLFDMICALTEALPFSISARAMAHAGIGLFLARLGPECMPIAEIVRSEPSLKKRVETTISTAEAALNGAGQQRWVQENSVASKLRSQLNSI